MVRQDKNKSRVTAKGTRPEGAEASEISPRNTAPLDMVKPSPQWFLWLIVAFFVLGMLMIVVNYIAIVLPGAPSNWYLFGGLGLVLAGIVSLTQYH